MYLAFEGTSGRYFIVTPRAFSKEASCKADVSVRVKENVLSLKNLFLLQLQKITPTGDGQETNISHKPRSLSFDSTCEGTI